MATAAKKTTRKPAKKAATRKPRTTTEPQASAPKDDKLWTAKLEAYSALSRAGLPIPQDLNDEVEAWASAQREQKGEAEKARQKAQIERAKADEGGPKWVRNCHRSHFSLKLERQKDGKSRIELSPRGQRGDLFPLQPGDEQDHNMIMALGHVEIIGQTEAQEVIAHQTNNIQAGVHTPLAILRNAKGEPYTQQNVIVETEYNRQGVTVAVVNPNDRDNLVRPEEYEKAMQFIPTGGNPAIVSSGFEPPSQGVTDNAHAAVEDALARDTNRTKQLSRPEDVLGLSVQIAPTQKS